MEEITRTYNVPLRLAYEHPPYRRGKVAIRIIRQFSERHMKAKETKIEEDVNELIWDRGIRYPPRHITLEMERDEDGIVTVRLPKEPEPETDTEKE
jgi:large subunit ribosomal protein L31e